MQPGGIEAALEAFQRERIRQTSKELLFSRHLGRLKQCLDRDQDWFQAGPAAGAALAQRNMATFPEQAAQ